MLNDDLKTRNRGGSYVLYLCFVYVDVDVVRHWKTLEPEREIDIKRD